MPQQSLYRLDFRGGLGPGKLLAARQIAVLPNGVFNRDGTFYKGCR
jgi:hypothetical protein